MRAVIMAGGKGTRLFSLTNDEIPKPMVNICGKPILEHQIEVLHRNGIDDIIIIVGHRREKITDYFGDGSAFDVNIQYLVEEMPLGTAGSFVYLKDLIKQDFLLVYGDIIFDIDLARMASFHKEKEALATLFVHPNGHPYDSDLVVQNEAGRVISFDSKDNKRDYYYDNCVNSGIYILAPTVLAHVQEFEKIDLEKDILFKMVNGNEAVYGYHSPEYVKDIGTPERLKKAEQDIISGFVASRNLTKPQKCVFVDRDGTVNIHKGLVYREEDFELEPCAIEAFHELNNSEYLGIIITNQPVVARNLCTIDQLEKIHKKLKTILGNSGVYVDDLLFCPHHPDSGYEGENPEYKIPCECRKPKTDLIRKCIDRYNIDLSASWFVGDTTVDIMTGRNAGLQTVLVKTGEAGKDGKYEVKADVVCDDLLQAVQYIRRAI